MNPGTVELEPTRYGDPGKGSITKSGPLVGCELRTLGTPV